MAGLTTLDKAAAVRVLVAIGTLTERNANILRFAIPTRCMTLLTSHLNVQAGQRIACLPVVELRHADRGPVSESVALLAVWPQAALVFVLVAGITGGRNAQQAPVQIFDLDGW